MFFAHVKNSPGKSLIMKILYQLILLFSFVNCSTVQSAESGPFSGLITDLSIDVQGEDREYHLFLPDQPNGAGVVFLFHGHSGSSDQIIGNDGRKKPYNVWLSIAERDNLILVIPNGNKGSKGKRGWNDCRKDVATNPNSDDVLFVSTLIDHILTEYKADEKRVYALGTSNGGHMTQRLAVEIPHKLAAFGSVVSSQTLNNNCIDKELPISALFMNGTEDTFILYDGGAIISGRGEVLSTEATVAFWVERNQTDTTPEKKVFPDLNRRDNSTVEKYHYKNGVNNTEVVLYKVIGGGHTEPSFSQRYSRIWLRVVGAQNGDIELANQVWSFFKDKSRS